MQRLPLKVANASAGIEKLKIVTGDDINKHMCRKIL